MVLDSLALYAVIASKCAAAVLEFSLLLSHSDMVVV